MDAIGLAASLSSISADIFDFVQWTLGLDHPYENQRWGSWGRVLSLLRLVDTRAVRQLHWNINTWTDEEVLSWKQSFMSTCSAIQVAVRAPCSLTSHMELIGLGCHLCQCRSHRPSVAQHGLDALERQGVAVLLHDPGSSVSRFRLLSTTRDRSAQQSTRYSFVA